jgi:peptide-methionine (S)-S-oxide reductase
MSLPGRAEGIPTAPTHFVDGAPLKGPHPQGSEVALFGLWCFWGAENASGAFPTSSSPPSAMPEVSLQSDLRGRVLGAHRTQRVLVVFDPTHVGYEELLKVFFESHDPTRGMRQGNDVGTQ